MNYTQPSVFLKRKKKRIDMAVHNELGKSGEETAVAYLEERGYIILHRNWRKEHLEIDIVAAKDNELIFIEVKTRSDDSLQDPIEAVGRQKIRRLLRAADAYLKQFSGQIYARFDIITLVGTPGNFKIEHYSDAFSPLSF